MLLPMLLLLMMMYAQYGSAHTTTSKKLIIFDSKLNRIQLVVVVVSITYLPSLLYCRALD